VRLLPSGLRHEIPDVPVLDAITAYVNFIMIRSHDMTYDVAIVGSGIAGLTTAAYLSAAAYSVAVFEKESTTGGLVNSFDYNGFRFDGGIRAIENSGIVLPMLRQLGLDAGFVRNDVSIGIDKDTIRLESEDSLYDYQAMLERQFPESSDDIRRIISRVRLVMDHMSVLYGIDNPLFLDIKKDREYLLKTILPWMFKFIFTIGKIQRLKTPIDEYLRTLTGNQRLNDMIAQHFFQKTPAFFALSYFSLYLDYQYPKGGTGVLTDLLAGYVRSHGGNIFTNTRITGIDPANHEVTDAAGSSFGYKMLVWAADIKSLYRMADPEKLEDPRAKRRVKARQAAVSDKIGNDSILTLYLTVDLDRSYFDAVCSAHFFYTPLQDGLANIPLDAIRQQTGSRRVFSNDKTVLFAWVSEYLRLTTYEIAIPVMRDESLAPPGKTGLIISTLFDYSLTVHFSSLGLYDEFKTFCAGRMLDNLDASCFRGLKAKVSGRFVSTPLTLQEKTGNSDGAITGWSFTNQSIPAVSDMLKVARSVRTPIPGVLQAGQWVYSPSGLPTSIMTGKLAADRVKKLIKPGKPAR
jgi:phytoene dehydrogenase-like protein